MLTVVSLSAASSSMNVTHTQIASSAMIRVRICVLRKIASLKLVELKTSFKMMTESDVAEDKVSFKR